MNGAGVIAALLSLGLGFPVAADAYANADNAATTTSSVGEPSAGEATTASFSVERIRPSEPIDGRARPGRPTRHLVSERDQRLDSLRFSLWWPFRPTQSSQEPSVFKRVADHVREAALKP